MNTKKRQHGPQFEEQLQIRATNWESPIRAVTLNKPPGNCFNIRRKIDTEIRNRVGTVKNTFKKENKFSLKNRFLRSKEKC